MHKKLEEILQKRLQDNEAIQRFLTEFPEYDPFLLKDMHAVVDRIVLAQENVEHVIVYGDFDVDGVTASAVVSYALERAGIRTTVYIPDRFTEGYGLRTDALDTIRRLYPNTSLIITVDCGVTAHNEVQYARKLGFDVIVTDHHRIQEDVPDCLVLNPNQPGCPYPNKHLVGVGVAYKLVDALCRRRVCSPIRRREIIDLVALGTIADIGTLVGENRTLVRYGLDQMNYRERVGLRVLFDYIGIAPETPAITAQDVGFRIGPVINAAGRFEHAWDAFVLLTTHDESQARILAQKLTRLNNERKTMQATIVTDIATQLGDDPDPIIFVTGDWPQGITGLIATRLMHTYQRPAIVGAYTEDAHYDDFDAIIKCSGRAPETMDISATLEPLHEHLIGIGGHPQACGFSLHAENEEAFRAALKTTTITMIGTTAQTTQEPAVDARLEIEEISRAFYDDLQKIGPFGKGNPDPIFETEGYLTECRIFEKVVRLKLSAGGMGSKSIDMVWFFATPDDRDRLENARGELLRVHYTLGINVWHGQITVQPIVQNVVVESVVPF